MARSWAKWISICLAKASIGSFMKNSSRICARSVTPAEKGVAEKSDQYLRSPSRLVASQSRRRKSAVQLSRARRDAVAVCARNGLHAHRTAADRGASVRRFVGLSGHELFCADEPPR